MLFSSNIFLFLFLPCVLMIYYLLHKPYRNIFLLLASILFYAYGEPRFIFVMLASIVFNYLLALAIDRLRGRRLAPRLLLALSVLGNLGVLFAYKYLDFFIRNINLLGFDLPLKNIVLPIGISFFTFQAMSYVIDVYRGDAAVQTKPQNVALYIFFFPQLIAGPIVRYRTIAGQIEGRAESFDSFADGVRRFILGLAKKVIIANNLALIADKAFAMPDAQRSVLFAWVGAIAYSFQILFDFSGYSEMAIGLGKMFGFSFLENFDYPYISKSISEFWRRWHMSLGQWFRDYVYIPLGGSRVGGRSRLLLNLLVVWGLTGIWHGASWNFVCWGLFYFVLIAFEKISGLPGRLKNPAARGLYRVFTLLCVVGGWVLFRAPGARAALGYGATMLGLGGNALTCANVAAAVRDYWFFFLAAGLCSSRLFPLLRQKADGLGSPAARAAANALALGGYIFLLVWAVSFIMLGSHDPFIYFNF